MPSSTYRRKLRTQTIEQPIVSQVHTIYRTSLQQPPSYPHPPPYTQPSPQHYLHSSQLHLPPEASENTTDITDIHKIYTSLLGSFEILTNTVNYEEAIDGFRKIIDTTYIYSGYFNLLDKIDEYVLTIETMFTDPLDKDAIKTQIHAMREYINTLPDISRENTIIGIKIKSLLQFIIKAVNIDTFKYTLVYTLNEIQAYIKGVTTYNDKLEEIHTLIFGIIDNIKNEAPSNVISWRINYLKDLVVQLSTPR